MKGGVSGDALGALLAVSERSRCEGRWDQQMSDNKARRRERTDGELALSTDGHAGDSLVPALDDLSAAKSEHEGGALGVGAGLATKSAKRSRVAELAGATHSKILPLSSLPLQD